ncbi:DNA polymerase III subunit gamma/tau [Alkalicella caledoniensis]|uniref:DNA-directed DNA polymerase n=1 Tax=Alkalicella caledoniensis TaxID=2731377 RepID=A0A7G9W8H1_ALKCA|nr:DNA polymerase III subunit gamma/tau [Alkalicella caledoniensis]QNO14983.1 DNA polymerase III subunit gamma/tau [Alkalicella caledoniensis]
MEYKALYRKLRPKDFSEGYVAQQHIRTTLQNSLSNNKVAHAYLFSGPRGTGKTSTAKIFAKAVNCVNGPTADPCNTCKICTKINENSSLDVLEIDAASNRGIDEIRELRDRVNYAPSEARYKVYIIDEVHMLTTEAFNALLKTLEEPPSHVIFILATTEPHKLPATILSRCQRFDFRRFTNSEIAEYLIKICEQNNIIIDKMASELLANKADGSMRDALSLLDQMFVYGQGEISTQLVLDVMGTLSPITIKELSEYILNKDLDKALELVNIVIEEGKDIRSFLQDIVESLRNTMFDYIKEKRDTDTSVQELIKIIGILIEGEKEIRASSHPKIILETMIIKTMESEDRKIAQLEKRIEELEAKIVQGTINLNSLSYKQENTDNIKDVNVVSVNNSKLGIESIKKNWDRVLFSVKKESVSTHAWLKEGVINKLEGNQLEILYDEKFLLHRENIMKDSHRDLIQKTIFETTGVEVNIVAITKDTKKQTGKQSTNKKDNLITIAEQLFGEDKVEVKD